MSRSTESLQLLIAPETVIGVPAPANKKLTTLGISFDANDVSQFFRPRGKKHRTSGVRHRQWAVGSYEGGLDYNELAYVLDSLYGAATPTTLGASGGYERTWLSSNLPVTPKSFTVKEGDTTAAEQVAGLLLTSLEMAVDTQQATISGNIIGSAIAKNVSPVGSTADEVQSLTMTGSPTGGTFTLTFGAQTTAAIPYNCTAAEVQAAIEALSNFEVGDVLVFGGPFPTKVIYIFFQGQYKETNVAMFTDTESLTGGTSPTVTEAVILSGASAFSTIARQPIGMTQWDIFTSDTLGGLDTLSNKTCRGLEFNLSVPDKLEPTFALCTDYPSIYDYVETNQEGLVSRITVRNETDMIALAAAWDVTTKPTKYVRFQAKGALIGSNAGTPVYYLLQIDFAAQVESVRDRRNIQTIYAKDFNLQLVDDDTLGGAVRFKLVNVLATV